MKDDEEIKKEIHEIIRDYKNLVNNMIIIIKEFKVRKK